MSKGLPCRIDDAEANKAAFPPDLEKPILAIPAASRVYCYAVALYGPHEAGTDLHANEREMLRNLGSNAADAYARLENEHLRSVIAELQAKLPASGVPA